MRTSFVDLRLMPGELLCGAAHDILTRSALVRVATRRHVTTAGEECPVDGWRKVRLTFLGRTQANANVNYSCAAKSVL
jgi:hypothetical protein